MQQDRGGMQKDSYAHLTPSPPLPRKRGREQTEFVARRFTPHQQWHHLHLHHHPPAREERRERVCRLNGFHFTAATGSAADWRGDKASRAKIGRASCREGGVV